MSDLLPKRNMNERRDAATRTRLDRDTPRGRANGDKLEVVQRVGPGAPRSRSVAGDRLLRIPLAQTAPVDMGGSALLFCRRRGRCRGRGRSNRRLHRRGSKTGAHARWIAAAGSVISPALLISDLGRPERFLEHAARIQAAEPNVGRGVDLVGIFRRGGGCRFRRVFCASATVRRCL